MLRTGFDSYIMCLAATSRRPVAIVLTVLLQTGVPHLSEGAPGGKTEVLPVEKAAPAAVVIETAGTEQELRRQMRAKTGVSELGNGAIRFSQAPTGSYGFIAPKQLGMALVTQSPDLVLERMSSSSGSYEIHKIADGSGLLVGFVGSEVASQIKPSERPKSVRLSLYSNPSGNAAIIAAVPLIKLMVDQMPRQSESHKRDGPVVLDMDLQGTANRKSPVAK